MLDFKDLGQNLGVQVMIFEFDQCVILDILCVKFCVQTRLKN